MSPRRSAHATRRATARWVGVIAVLASTAAVASTAAAPSLAAGGSASPTPTRTATTIRHERVGSWGTYAVVVSVPPTPVPELIDVFAGTHVQRQVQVSKTQGAVLAFSLRVRSKTFIVRVVGPQQVRFTVASARQRTANGSTSQTGPTGPTSPTGPTGATGPTSPVAPATGPYTKLVFSDEFTGPAGTAPDPTKWTADSGGGCGVGTLSTNTTRPANAGLDGAGQLAINALGPTATPPYSTAQLDTAGHFSFTYGRIEARIDMPPGQGLCSAFWLLADDAPGLSWPNGGEVDVMEAIGDVPSQANAFLHGPMTGDPNYQQWSATLQGENALAGGFHTYGLIWRPNSMTWTFDGVPFATATPKSLPPSARWVYNGHPFHIIFDLAVGGWPGNPNAATTFPASMRVDWVHVYQ
jgi:beta-glucanase (GH16 family)